MEVNRKKFLFLGVIYLLIAFLFMMDPITKVAIFAQIIGIVLLLVGIFTLVDSIFVTKGTSHKIFRFLEGLITGAFGLIFFLRNPNAGALMLVYAVIWIMIFTSFFNTVMLFNVKAPLKWVSIVLNVLVLWFGIQSIFDPALAAAIFYWTVALQLTFMGVNHITLYFVFKDVSEDE